MAAFSILLGYKGENRETVKISDPQEINADFKELVLIGGGGFDKVEIITSRAGRTKRRRFNKGVKAEKPKATTKTAKGKTAKVKDE